MKYSAGIQDYPSEISSISMLFHSLRLPSQYVSRGDVMKVTVFVCLWRQIVIGRRWSMALQDVQVGALLSVDFLVGVVLRVERKGLVPSALIHWEDGIEVWMPVSEMQNFVIVSKDVCKIA